MQDVTEAGEQRPAFAAVDELAGSRICASSDLCAVVAVFVNLVNREGQIMPLIQNLPSK